MLAGALVLGTLSCGPGLGAPFYKNDRCFLKLVQSGKTIQYVFILGYFRNYKTLCDRKNLSGGRGGPLTTGALCHGINGTMVNPALGTLYYTSASV